MTKVTTDLRIPFVVFVLMLAAALLLQRHMNREYPEFCRSVPALLLWLFLGCVGLCVCCCSSQTPGPQAVEEEVLLNTTDNDEESAQGNVVDEATSHKNRVKTLEVEEALTLQVPSKTTRIYYLDNLKTFLTFLVVAFHTSCAFGGCKGMFPLVIAHHSRSVSVRFVLTIFNSTCQTFFMALFFFCAAYFMPLSYDRKGHNSFLLDKIQRLWVPTTLVIFVYNPLVHMAVETSSHMPTSYYPRIDHCWFPLWLLLFSVIYSQFRRALAGKSERKATVESQICLPSTPTRIALGLGCAIAHGVLENILGFQTTVFAMPLTLGSLPWDVLLFTAGIAAQRNQWLSSPEGLAGKQQQIDISIGALRWTVLVEVILFWSFLVAFLYDSNSFRNPSVRIPTGFLGGVLCSEISVVLLEWFQTNLNFTNKLTKALSQAAYTVFLIHPGAIVLSLMIFVRVYNYIYGDVIQWDCDKFSCSTLKGPDQGGIHVLVGFLLTNLVANLVLWPFAYWLAHRPVLRNYLL